MDEQMPETQPGDLPEKPYLPFFAMAQGKTDYTVEALNINGMLTLCATEEAVYVTKQQAMAFFGLIDPAALSQPAAADAVGCCWKTSDGVFHNFSPISDAAASGAACRRMAQTFYTLHPKATL